MTPVSPEDFMISLKLKEIFRLMCKLYSKALPKNKVTNFRVRTADEGRYKVKKKKNFCKSM
jgi:hypothetical protein